MERYHATSVLSLTARHPARAERTPDTGCNASSATAAELSPARSAKRGDSRHKLTSFTSTHGRRRHLDAVSRKTA
jgi:hypothetical protein